ncbi:ATP-binding protein [Pectinatus sottacetonis]|uniref:ATP-binding protein n=1 Tax=Pectinatus sottacetonis TaxID=1002795 RepID=UPI0018C6466B|nr:ATP-binding protein [Pectinatus sottacetonis]
MIPFNSNYFIGYVNYVNPQYIKVHFPSSILLNKYIFSGEEFNGGLIGTFVTIEGENYGFIGKISELNLPEKERLSLSEKAFQSSDFHPTAKVEILLSFDYFDSKKVQRTLNAFPSIGSKVYICPKQFIQQYVMSFGVKSDDDKILIKLGKLTSNRHTLVNISQQAIFGRHCAIVGTTGGGKSWSVSKLIESMMKNHTKAILIDPTGEYSDIASNGDADSVVLGDDCYFSYRKLTIEDLFFLVRPAEKIQAPKLLEAIRSLKCIELGIKEKDGISSFCQNGCLIKTGLNKLSYERYCYENDAEIENGILSFDINKLEWQINNECVWPSKGNNTTLYGNPNSADLGNCISLITRIGSIRRTGIWESVFGFSNDKKDKIDLTEKIDNFIDDNKKFLLRIGFEKLGFESQGREIAANAIGKYLLDKARKNKFKKNPVVLFLDEAHQFLKKDVTDNYFNTSALSSFDQIAKECRKYGLFLCLATQMPRDIPVGTLSQMGTFLVHRLINYNDKEAIKQACSSANSELLSFLPVLGEGEAILTGVDFPMPLTIKIDKPNIPPDSRTPIFKKID